MFESLSEKLQEIIRNTAGKSKLDEENINEALREVRRALLEADVSLKVVKAFISNIKDRSIGEEVFKSLTPGQQLVKIVHEELTSLMGGENKALSTEGKPNIIMLLGLQGSGKTTSCAKLAINLRKSGRNPLMIAADVYRPAAISQLQSLGKQIGVAVFTIDGSSDVRNIVTAGIEHAKNNGFNSVLIDTAGRLEINTELMAELVILDRLFNPAEKLLVIDSMTGQAAVNVAQTFNEHLDLTGVILTKLDGDARGGSALSVTHITGKPIKFVGTGEKLDALEPFHPDRMAQRILGMGDVLSLIEKAQESFDLESAKELEKKMRTKEFSLEDFLKVQKQMKMFGSIDQILGMLPIPGLSKKDREQVADAGEKQMKKIESIINSMTVKERKTPELINQSRKIRISKGSGNAVEEVNKFLKEFENMRKMMKKMADMTKNMRKGHGKKGHGMMNLPPGMQNRFPRF
jgi:signal recognition particle subunit SRP54